MPFLVILLMSFFGERDKGLCYYSPWSSPGVATGRGKHVHSWVEKDRLKVIDLVQPPQLSEETQTR